MNDRGRGLVPKIINLQSRRIGRVVHDPLSRSDNSRDVYVGVFAREKHCQAHLWAFSLNGLSRIDHARPPVAPARAAWFNAVSSPVPRPLFPVPSHAMDLQPKLFVFLLATFLGLEVIRRVSPLLHTPLMSLTNAISAIAIVAAIQVISQAHTTFSTVLGTLAVIAATTNIVGGFWITDRMLKMFRRETKTRER